jgi:flagellar hook-associated protein 2
MGTISFAGLATGLDTNSLIQQILAVQQQPIAALQTKKVKFQALSTAFQDLNNKLVSFKTRADGLKDPARFFSRSVTSSLDTVAWASAAPGAVKGTFTLTASGLARGSIAAASVTKSSTSDTVASTTDTFQFKLGTSGSVVNVSVTPTTTLDQLVAGINNASAGVRASLVNAGSSGTPAYKLVLTSNATGAANDIVIVHDPTTLSIANTQTAVDATFSVTGLGSFTRSTNTFSDVIDSVTITLKAGSGSTDLAVDYDASATQSKVQSLIDSFNTVVGAIDTQSAVTQNPGGTVSTGAFTGDSTPRLIRTTLAGAMDTTAPGAFSRMAQLGIITQRDGTLALDETKFRKALTDNPLAVSALIAGTATTPGIAAQLSSKLASATQAITGTIAVRQDGITTTIKNIQQQIDTATARLNQTQDDLKQRFAALEQQIARLQQTGNALLAQLANLGASSKSSSGG